MDYDAFVASVESGEPPMGLRSALLALWWAGKGNWEKAHALAQDAGNLEGDWVHAYLHRLEGDEGNAAYWYSRSGKAYPEVSLVAEWEAISRALLG